MKPPFALPGLIIFLLALFGCSHPIEIQGKGDVRSASGARNCSLVDFEAGKDTCRKNLVVGAYSETYFAEPHAGWEFDHWKNYCTDASNNACTFKVKADTVQQNWGKTVAPLVAVFAEQGGFSQGVVSTPHPLAAEAGLKVLEAGGNAVDAAAVIQFVLNVVEPPSSGIGGGGFMGIHLAAQDRSFFIDSREKAPAAASPTMFLKCDPNCEDSNTDTIGSFDQRATSGIAVGVPGTLLGVAASLERYGTLTLAQALQPAIALAENGFNIDQRLAKLTRSDRVAHWPETAAIFRTPGGGPLPEGFKLVQADLAKTLRLIAEQGVEVFYRGEIARAMVQAQTRYRPQVGPQGAGRMSLQDLAAYMAAGVVERNPTVTAYRDLTLLGMPAPSSGGYTVSQILQCIEQFPMGDTAAGFGFGTRNTVHVMAEAMRLAFSSRRVWMGDNDFVRLPLVGLTDPGYLAPRCAQIKVDSRMDDPEPGDPRNFDPGFATTNATIASAADEPGGINTTHFTVIDRSGNVVTYTSTIESTWGSGITVPGYGFLLNNELTDFNAVPTANADNRAYNPGANDIAPGKRPRSSMAPVMVFDDGQLVAAYGSPGGSTIINTVVNMTVNLIDHGMSVQHAIDAPRFHTSGGALFMESGFPQSVLEGLRALGHTVNNQDEQGSVQAIIVDPATGRQYGGADSRRSGTVMGLPRP